MSASIQTLLDNIMNARYGEEVRSSIHDSIELCYSDVSASQTVADAAAANANDAATAATNAATAATNATNAANTAAQSANNASTNASNAATSATTAADSATNAANSANTAKLQADVATGNATSAANSANTAATNATNAATNALNASSTASSAADRATNAASAAEAATSRVDAAISDCDTAKTNATTAAASAVTATTRANTAASAIEDMSVTSENVGPDDSAEASVSIVNGHKNIHFKLKQGATGAPFLVKGSAYASLSDLEEGVESPSVGDQYNVGTEPPYTIYRWTGVSWESQGSIGVSFDNLTESEINTIWNGTAISSSNNKYINHTGLYHLIVNKIQAALNGKVNVVSGKGLSTNDFTTEYKDQVDTNTSSISSLSTLKVDKVSGKGLSTNDFTTEYKTKLDGLNPSSTDPLMDGTASAGSATTFSRSDHVHPRDTNQILYFYTQAVSAASNAEVARITNAKINTNTIVLECTFADDSKILTNITWTSYSGYIAFTGTVSGSTTMNVTLGLKGN